MKSNKNRRQEMGATQRMDNIEGRPSAVPVMVTPEMASKWLENKAPNRNMNTRRIDQYARDMERGAWFPVSMIVFDEDGNLIDGEHRLRAVVKCGKTVTMLVLRGANSGWRAGIDMLQPRAPRQTLSMFYGMTSATWKVSAEKIIMAAKSRDNAIIPSVNELYSEYMDNKDAYDEALSIQVMCRKMGLPVRAGFLAGMFLVIKYGIEDEGGRRAFNDFANKVKTGEELKNGSPCLALRAALLRNNDARTGRIGVFVQAVWVLKAWEDFVCGNQRILLKVPSRPWFDFLDAYDRLKEIHDASIGDLLAAGK